jgi:hypothetical protein
MKQTITLMALLFIVTFSQAQIGIGTNTPHASAQLDVSSTSKGFLPPRMTTLDRDAISSPATGLQIYNTDNKAIETFTGTAGEWFRLGSGNGSRYDNTALGVSTLNSNVDGYANTAIGYASLYANTDGIQNTTIGNQSLNSNTTGNGNTANGHQSLSSNTTGSNNTALGFQANVNTGALNNATAIGSGAIATSSNMVRIGNATVTVIEGQVAFTSVSDARIKENIKETVPGLAFIAELRPVTYTLNIQKQEAITMQAMPDSIKAKHSLSNDKNTSANNIVRTGFIAQEVEAAAKKIGYDFDGVSTPQNETDLYGIRYAEFVVPLVKAVQEQQLIIEKLLKRIEALEKK